MSQSLVQIHNLKKYYTSRKKELRAVDGISLSIQSGETLGIVGESGCGKSTFGQVVGQLLEPTDGHVYFEGKSLASLKSNQRKILRKDVQYVFQDALSALNPRHKISKLLEEPLIIQKIGSAKERHLAVQEMLQLIGLKGFGDRYIHELSGGQRQRIGIGRALILKPKFLILDEPVSALDVSIQAQILNLLVDLQRKFDLTYLFISHDLHVVEFITKRVAVMYLGKIVEIGDVEQLYENPKHPYTQALMSAVPSIYENTEQIILQGDLPNPLSVPSGCSFHTRCPFATEFCKTQAPDLKELNANHAVSCHYAV